MTATKSIIDTGITLQATALVGENVRLAKKKKKTTKDFVGTATKNIVGIKLLQVQSQLASGL